MSKNYESKIPDINSYLGRQIEKLGHSIGTVTVSGAMALCPVGRYPRAAEGGVTGAVGGNLRGSITYEVDMEEGSVFIGSAVEYAPYVHFGTGKYAEGGKGRDTPWWYFDEHTQSFRFTHGQKPNPFLEDAAKDLIIRGVYTKMAKMYLGDKA